MKANRTPFAISWESHSRMRGLCDWLGIELIEFEYSGSAPVRYLLLGWRTCREIFRRRPSALLVQNPSIVLSLLAIICARFGGCGKVFIDAHNEAVIPYVHDTALIRRLAAWLMRNSFRTIVSNEALSRIVSRAGGRPLTLPDRLPNPPGGPALPLPNRSVVRIMVVASYAPDEPLVEVALAARSLGLRFEFLVTGNIKRMPKDLRDILPDNMKPTGFLPEHEYWQLMRDSHVVLDLSKMPECVVCGAYEALAVGRPMILSDNDASRALFAEVAIFTVNDSKSIAAAVWAMDKRREELSARAAIAREAFVAQWTTSGLQLRTALLGDG